MTLAGVAVRRPVLAAVASALIIVFGLIAGANLPLRELPDVDPPVVSVDTVYVGANAEVVENRVTQLIEDQLSSVDGVDTITSESRDGRSSINITFRLNRDLDAAANDVRDSVARVADRLPEEAEAPEVRKQDPDARPVMWFSLSSDELSVTELSDYARRFVTDRLSVIDGVSFVRVGGGQDYAMRVELDRRAMAARGLTVDDIEAALRAQNVELPAGELESDTADLGVRVDRGYVDADSFRRLPVGSTQDGHVIRLGEVATVFLGPDERRALFRGNGVTRVGLGVVRQSKANTLEVGRLVRAEVARISETLPDGITIDKSFDGTVFIDEAIKEVWRTLAVAFGLVVVVIYLFLGSLRAALVPAVVAPVSIVGVFVVLSIFGFSINILTLLAMILAIGLVVDDSIVVLENIQRRVDLGEPPLVAADRGANQVFFAVVATTAVIVAVFAPLTFLPGYVGRVFVELALTVAGAVVISSFVALTLSPMMCSKLLQPATERALPARVMDAVVGACQRSYVGALRLTLGRPAALSLVLLAAAGASWWLFERLDREVVPREDRGAMFVGFTAPPGAGFDYTTQQAAAVEEILLDYVESGEADLAIVRVPGFGATGFSSGFAFLVLTHWNDRERDGHAIVGELNRRLGELTGVRVFAGMRSALGGGGDGDDIEFVLQGPDYETLDAAAEDLIALTRQNPALQRPRKNYEPTSPRLVVTVDRERAAALGVTNETIGRSLEAQLGSRVVGTFPRGGEEYNVKIQNRLEDRRSPTDLENNFVRSVGTDALVPLSSLVSLKEVGEAPIRTRVNRLRSITITATLAEGYSLGEAVAWFEDAGRMNLPPGVSSEFLGAAKDLDEANQALRFALIMALAIVFLVLAAQFESLINPLVIMLTVPLAVAGGLFGLYVVGSSLNIYSQIGLVVLIGLAAKNGILIVEFANQLRADGWSVRDAVLEAADTRFRPIVMTGLSTAIGSLPLVLASGAGAESRITIGVVIFAGVLVATLFTLIIVPAFYDAVGRFTRPPGWVAKQIDAYAAEPAGAQTAAPRSS